MSTLNRVERPSFSAFFAGPEHAPFRFEPDSAPVGTAVLVHGFPGTPAELRPLGEALRRQGWLAHGILLPGFGPEIDTLAARRCEDWIGAACAALAGAMTMGRPALIIGHSLGGALALRAAAELNPAGAILLAPFWRVNHVLWTFLPILKYVFPNFKPFNLVKLDFDDPETRKGITSFMPEADPDDPAVRRAILNFSVPTNLFDQLRRAGDEAYQAAPRLRSATLVLQGDQDTLVTPSNTRQLIARMPKPPVYHPLAAEHDLINPAKPAWAEVERLVLGFAGDLARVSAPTPLQRDR
ncbi:MAG: alpha/beta fold hydrolase [Aggregatilineales bacterium]